MALARGRFWGHTLLNGLVLMPLILPPVVTGYLLLILFGRRGPIGAFLADTLRHRLLLPLDRRGARLRGDGLSADGAGHPPVDRGGRHRLEEAAGTLGANRAWVFATVTLPLMLPGIIAGMILCFAKAMGEFGATITFVSNIPGETQTLPSAIYTFTQVPGGDAGAMRLTLVSIAISMLALHGLRGDGTPRQPPARRRMTLSLDIRHRLGAFRLDARFETGGGLIALFGRSGAGKTSLVNIIAGLIRPDEGRVAIDDAVLVDTSRGVFVPRHKRRIGYVFQEGRLFPHLTVRQNLLYGRWFTPQAPRCDDEPRQGGRAARHRRPARAAAGPALGRREAARRHRPRPARRPAAAADGRAAGLPRRGAQGRDPALHRAAARPGPRAHRLRQPLDRRGGAARHHDRAAVGGQGGGGRARRQRSCTGSTCSR